MNLNVNFEAEAAIAQKIMKANRLGTPKLCWADEDKFEDENKFKNWGHFEGRIKKEKLWNRSWQCQKYCPEAWKFPWFSRIFTIFFPWVLPDYQLFHKKIKVVPPTRTTWSVPWSGLRWSQKSRGSGVWTPPYTVGIKLGTVSGFMSKAFFSHTDSNCSKLLARYSEEKYCILGKLSCAYNYH